MSENLNGKIVFRLKVATEWAQSQMYLNYAEREQVRQSQGAAGFSFWKFEYPLG